VNTRPPTTFHCNSSSSYKLNINIGDIRENYILSNIRSLIINLNSNAKN
jgi:hypothetical protein